MKPHSPGEQAKALGQALGWLDALNGDLAAVTERLRDWSLGTSSGRAPTAKNSVSDPTGNTALMLDQWGQARQRMSDLIDQVYRCSLDLDAIRRDVMTPPPPKLPEERGLRRCANIHGCPDDAWQDVAGRCRTCYEYKRRTDRDRTRRGGGE